MIPPDSATPPLSDQEETPPVVSVAVPSDFFINYDRTALMEGRMRSEACSYQDIYRGFYLPETADKGRPSLEADDSTLADLQRIYPNLRDLGVSSNMSNIQPNMLYRSARPFVENVTELKRVTVDFLGIRTIIDLRSDELTSRCENLSRNMELMVYSPRRLSNSTKDRQKQKLLVWAQMKSDERVERSILSAEKRLKERTKVLRESMDHMEFSGLPEDTRMGWVTEEESINRGLRCCEEGRLILAEIKASREERDFYVVNFLDTPECSDRVKEQLLKDWHTVPILAGAKILDRVMKTNNAEYYFSKFFIANASVEESYYEMLVVCKTPINDALKLLISLPHPCTSLI
eukprot:GHVH01005722.1.p1 GENE.GHVH01005722.1~~GHVH01005722.1.p1  ORF type:complete len:367 (+),score=57.15 GHVH01005722.1:62-1102(+)